MTHYGVICKSTGVLFALLLQFAAFSARAAIACSVSVTAVSTVYDPTVATENVTTGSYTVSCTRLASDPASYAWQLAANNGLNPTGGTNRVTLGASTYLYELYRAAPYSGGNKWQDSNPTRITGTLNFGASLSASQTGPFDMRLAGSQTVVAAGTYLDTVTATLRDGGGSALNTATFGVTVITSPTCQFTAPPGNIVLNYTSFQPTSAATSTTYSVRCSSGLAYTMALDATSGTLLGLTYNLGLSAPGGTGTGLAQTYTVNGDMAANQAGTCATATCAATAARTVTVTY